MGWLSLMVKEKARSWLSMFGPKSKVSADEAVWGKSSIQLFVTWLLPSCYFLPTTYNSSHLVEKVYATLSSGVITLFTIKRDGKSKKRSFGLYGSAIGIAKCAGSKHCFRVLDGIEPIILQAESSSSMMDWATSIAHSISMENGGGWVKYSRSFSWSHEYTLYVDLIASHSLLHLPSQHVDSSWT